MEVGSMITENKRIYDPVNGDKRRLRYIEIGNFRLIPDTLHPGSLWINERQYGAKILVRGGTGYLRVEDENEIFYLDFLRHLSSSQVKTVSRLVPDLPNIYPDYGTFLSHRVGLMDEKEIIPALSNLFKGVSFVERIKFLSRLPFFGKRLSKSLHSLAF
jgi:hypothetical protein